MKSPLGLPELTKVYKHISKCMPQNDEILRTPVDVFADEPFAGCRNAVVEYLGKYPGRLEILNSKPRELSNPPGVVYTFPGLKSEHKTGGYPSIRTTFDGFSIDHYQRLHQTFAAKLPDRFSESQMQLFQTLLTYEMQYLRGCDLQWVPNPAGKFSSLAMLQDRALTVRIGRLGRPIQGVRRRVELLCRVRGHGRTELGRRCCSRCSEGGERTRRSSPEYVGWTKVT